MGHIAILLFWVGEERKIGLIFIGVFSNDRNILIVIREVSLPLLPGRNTTPHLMQCRLSPVTATNRPSSNEYHAQWGPKSDLFCTPDIAVLGATEPPDVGTTVTHRDRYVFIN